MESCEILFETLAIHGGTQYGLEKVSQLDHALQCAALAEHEEERTSLIVAALFHDIGHLIDNAPMDAAQRTVDDLHETRGAAILSRWFDTDVTGPVRLHVPAKRYLCAIDPDYYAQLSFASQRSLEMQGNPFDQTAARAFIEQPYAEDAVCLRLWDDRAKVPDLIVPDLDHYRPYVEALLSVPERAAS